MGVDCFDQRKVDARRLFPTLLARSGRIQLIAQQRLPTSLLSLYQRQLFSIYQCMDRKRAFGTEAILSPFHLQRYFSKQHSLPC